MRRYPQKTLDQRQSVEPTVSRRVMLIASGGLMLGVAGVVGCANDRLAAATLDQTPTPVSARTTPRRTPSTGKTGTTGASGPSPHPAVHPKSHATRSTT